MEDQRSRLNENYKTSTLSFWSYALDNFEKFSNEFYKPEKDILDPDPSEKVLRVWKELYYPENIKIFHEIEPFVLHFL